MVGLILVETLLLQVTVQVHVVVWRRHVVRQPAQQQTRPGRMWETATVLIPFRRSTAMLVTVQEAMTGN